MCATKCLLPIVHAASPRLVDLPCGCQDAHRTCGCICREHEHVPCDGQPATTSEENDR